MLALRWEECLQINFINYYYCFKGGYFLLKPHNWKTQVMHSDLTMRMSYLYNIQL